ncbi:MAG: UDP-N-acetylglucosamine 1-carboxyvinyltransferase [Candidatus Paceibacterota bacterium]
MEEEIFLIKGGNKLSGEISVRGSKNAAFPVLMATLLTEEDCVIDNIPLVEDIFRLFEIFESMDVKVSWLSERKVKINAKGMDPLKINKQLVLKFRGSVLLFGAILARFKKVELPQPGGCIIGARPIDTHLNAFSQAGVEVKEKNNNFSLIAPEKIKENEIILNEISVTGTENILLFCSTVNEKMVIKGADGDYQNQELAKVLKKMGVKISGEGQHKITIKGADKLKGFKHFIMYDPIEAGTFILLALAAKGDILVKNVEYNFLEFPLKKLKDWGAQFEIKNKKDGRADIRVIPSEEMMIFKAQSLPYPGFPSDLLSPLIVLATQTKDTTLIHDPLYESRFRYIDALVKMGADILLLDSHRANVKGPSKLFGTNTGSFDLRGGASLIIAGLIAEGETVISDIYQVDRGYEKIEERLKALGADIKRIKK